MDNQLEQLGERIAEQAAHLDAATHRLLADLRDFDERGGWRDQGAASCADWLSWRVGWDLVTARDHVRVARKLAEFPAIDDALRRGEVSYSKARAMLRAATPENETLLLEYAKLMTASQLEKLARKYALVQRHGKDPHPLGDEHRRYVRRRDTEDGMVKIEAVLHPEEAEMIWTMLNHAATQLARETEASAASDSTESFDPIHDSAESPASRSAPCTATATALPADRDLHPIHPVHDSAESPASPSAPCAATATALPAGPDPHPIHDSAESPVSGPAGSSVAGCRETASIEAASESPVRSLLDRLLDEADALRDAEAALLEEAAISLEETGVAPGVRAPQSEAGVLRQRADAAKRAFSRADALVSLAHGYLRGDRPNRSPIEIVLTIPQSSLRAEEADPVEVGEMGDSFLSAQAARRLACDAGVIEVVEDERGVPLSVGRKRRTIAGSLKRALHKRDTMCTFPSCTNRMFLEGHHVKHWADGGDTSLTNAALLCSLHHRYVHEYGYTIELGPDQRPRFRDPRGRLVAAVPERMAAAELGWPTIRAVNEPLGIDADRIAGPWDGTPVDYGRIVGHLAAADDLR